MGKSQSHIPAMLPFRQITAMAVKELIVLWKDREALALLFIMPLFFVLVMSFALEGIYSAGTRERPIELQPTEVFITKHHTRM